MPTVVAIRAPKQGDLVYNTGTKDVMYSLLKDTGDGRFVYITRYRDGSWVARTRRGSFGPMREIVYETDEWSP